MDSRCLLLLLAAASLLVSGSSAIPLRRTYRSSPVDESLLKALLRVQELEEEKAAEEEAEKEEAAEAINKLLAEQEARREEALAEERAEEVGRLKQASYDFEYPEYEDAEMGPVDIPYNDIDGDVPYRRYEPITADTRSLELPYNSYPRQQYEEMERRDDKYDLDKLYPDYPDPEPKDPEPEEALSPEEYAALLSYLGLQEDTKRTGGYYNEDAYEDYDPTKTAKRTRDNNAYHRAYNMFWSNLGKPREEEREWDDGEGDIEQDRWNDNGPYRVEDLGADKKALELVEDQGKAHWLYPGNDLDSGYTGYEPYQREKYPSPLTDVMESYGPEEGYYPPYEDNKRYQEQGDQPEWIDTVRNGAQDTDYDTFLTRNERDDKLLDSLYENQIPEEVEDALDTEDGDLEKYEEMAEALLREYPELASAAEKVIEEIIEEAEDEDADRSEDSGFGGAEEDGGPSQLYDDEPLEVTDRADKNPLEGYTNKNIDILQRKRLFDEEEEGGDEGEGDGDEEDKLPISYYDILKDNEIPTDAENSDEEEQYYDDNEEKKADVVDDYTDDYPDLPPETPEDDAEEELDDDRVEAFLDKVEDLLKATEAVSPPLCPVNVSDCHLIEEDSPLSSGPYKEYFTAVCNRHEACYQCGSAHGISSSTCDRAMKYDLAEVCDMLAEVEGQDVDDLCKMKGEALHLAARLKRSYQETTVPECSYKCVMEFIVGS